MAKEDLALDFARFLKKEGYSPEVDDDGDVVFKYEGGNYFVQFDEDDPEFIRVLYPSFWPLENDEERAKARQIAHDATTQTKVAKVYAIDDNMWAAIEAFCPSPESFFPVFRRSLGALQTCVRQFCDGMRE